jgi:hypothetical protein
MSMSELIRSLPTPGQKTLAPHHAGATVIAFQPLAEAGRSSAQHAGGSRGADPTNTATVIPFLLPGSPPPVQRVGPRSQSAAKSAKRADEKLITGEEEYRQRMFENLLAAAWLGTLMSAGYYMLNVLAP